MEVFKDIWNNPLMKKIIIAMLIIIGIFIFLIMVVACSSNGRTYTYDEVELLLVKNVKRKYENTDKLPSLNNKLEVGINELINDGIMKNLNEYTNTTDSCSAKVTIYNNNGYYLYVPNINCASNYKTNTLYEQLLDDSLVSSGNGLYALGNGFAFKGDNVNNYVKINNYLYRVISINENNQIKLIDTKKKEQLAWDDRFNVDKNSYVGINNYYSNNLNSRIKDSLESLYKDDSIYTDIDRAYFIPSQFCMGKRSINEFDNTGNIECLEYTPQFPLGLLSLYEYFVASLDTNCNSIESSSCSNYNYFSDNSNYLWTMTADKDTSYKVYKVTGGIVSLSNASNQSALKVVVNINGDNVISDGDGSLNNPYIIKSF